MAGYETITRLPLGDDDTRVYELTRAGRRSWIAWADVDTLLLPTDAVPERSVQLDVGLPAVTVETLITQAGESGASRTNVATQDGIATLSLDPTPVFIYPRQVPAAPAAG